MCSATLGATPVCAWTRAASSSFSYGVLGTPGCANTLKRVPELPNAHDGSSICCRLSASLAAARSVIVHLLPVVPGPFSWQVEDLHQGPHALVGALALQLVEQVSHLGLPALVHRRAVHRRARRGEVLALEVADQQPVLPQEQRVVAPARRPQGVAHLRPHR